MAARSNKRRWRPSRPSQLRAAHRTPPPGDDPKTVIRSGYGISYVQFNRLGGENLLAYNGPSFVDAFIDQVPTQPICASGATAPGACFRSTPQGFPTNLASPCVFQSP